MSVTKRADFAPLKLAPSPPRYPGGGQIADAYRPERRILSPSRTVAAFSNVVDHTTNTPQSYWSETQERLTMSPV
jgi:hypothetical protein